MIHLDLPHIYECILNDVYEWLELCFSQMTPNSLSFVIVFVSVVNWCSIFWRYICSGICRTYIFQTLINRLRCKQSNIDLILFVFLLSFNDFAFYVLRCLATRKWIFRIKQITCKMRNITIARWKKLYKVFFLKPSCIYCHSKSWPDHAITVAQLSH